MVKTLSREDIQRMIRRTGSAGSSVGSGGGISMAQVDAAYVSKAFFNQLFTIHGKRTYTDPETEEKVTEDVIISPNQIAEGEYSLSNVEVSVGLWTNSFLSALGIGSGGGGGGATALTDLVDVAIQSPQNGQVLTYDATLGKWKNAQGGGGDLTSAMLRIDHTYDTVDANNLKASGSHRLGAQGSNFPVSYPNYGQMLVVNGGDDTYAQLYFPYTSSEVYIRTGNPDNPSTGQWNAWKKVLTEGNAVTSVGMSVPTGFSVIGSPITSSGTLALTFVSGYSLPTTAKQTNWDTAYGWGNHAEAGYIKSANGMLRFNHNDEEVDANNLLGVGSHRLGSRCSHLPVIYPNYGQMLVVNGGDDTYAQFYFPYTSSEAYIRTGNPGNPSTGQWNAWKKVLTEGNAVTSVAMTVPTGFIVTGSPITSSGTLALSFVSGYSLPTTAKQNNWDTAYGWGNHAGLYLPLTGGTLTGTTTFNNGCWNIASNEANEISNKHWENNTLYNNDNTAVLFSLASIRNALRFRWYDSYWNIGNIRGGSTDSYGFGIAYEDTTNNRLIDCFHVDRYGTINSLLYFRNSCIGIGTSNPQYKLDVNGSIHSGSYVQIGNIRLVYDSTYNALKVIKNDGTAANLYATGGVSALGMSAGTSSIDAMAFNYLTVNNRIYFGNTSNYIYHDSDGINVQAGRGERLYVMNQIYTYGGLDSEGHIYTNGNHLYMGGGRIYLDSTRYLYVSGSTLYYYNGSQMIVIG